MPSYRLLPAMAGVCIACSSSPPSESVGFGVEPLVTTPSAHGLTVAVRTAPQPPIQGDDEAELTVTDAKGAAVENLDMSVVPFMPAMDHGTSIVPTVTPLGHGKYRVSSLELFMAGDWELRTTFSGPVNDSVNPVVYVP